MIANHFGIGYKQLRIEDIIRNQLLYPGEITNDVNVLYIL